MKGKMSAFPRSLFGGFKVMSVLNVFLYFHDSAIDVIESSLSVNYKNGSLG